MGDHKRGTRVVRYPAKALFQSTQLGIRPRLDTPLYSHGTIALVGVALAVSAEQLNEKDMVSDART